MRKNIRVFLGIVLTVFFIVINNTTIYAAENTGVEGNIKVVKDDFKERTGVDIMSKADFSLVTSSNARSIYTNNLEEYEQEISVEYLGDMIVDGAVCEQYAITQTIQPYSGAQQTTPEVNYKGWSLQSTIFCVFTPDGMGLILQYTQARVSGSPTTSVGLRQLYMRNGVQLEGGATYENYGSVTSAIFGSHNLTIPYYDSFYNYFDCAFVDSTLYFTDGTCIQGSISMGP
jgi:hypothetical protein